MRFSFVALVAALGVSSVAAESCSTPGTVLREINFSKDKHGVDIVASCWSTKKGECSGVDSTCLPLYPNYDGTSPNSPIDCINSSTLNSVLTNQGVKGGVCGCGDEVCGCIGYTPPGLAGGNNFPEFPYGMSVTANRQGSTAEAAMLFNSAEGQYTGDDNDLDVIGPVDWGNLIIISEDGNIWDPDDNAHGGHIQFTFDNPVEVVAMDYVDIEGHETSHLKAWDNNGAEITTAGGVMIPAVGDGHRNTMPFEYEGVKKVKVDLGGSGAISAFRICVPAGSSFGDPHFVTWGGDFYDYHGICDLLFLESEANNLTVHLRTEKKYHYSYISSAAIKINDDIFEFGSWGQVIANGVYLADDTDLPTTFGGHPMTLTRSNKNNHIYNIDLGDETGLEVKTYKEMVAVRVLGSSEKFMDAKGLMGSPSANGEKVGRDGAVWTDDLNSFGQEWQVTVEEPTLFQAVREPQAPQRCILPTQMGKSSELEIRRLGETLARSEAEEACADWKMNKEACISDVMITGDKDLAKAFYN